MTEPTLASSGLGAEPPFRLLLDEAVRWTRRHFRAIYPATAIPAALLSACAVAAQAIVQRPEALATADPYAALANMGKYFLIALPIILAGWLVQLAMQVATLDAVAGRGVDMQRAWRFVLSPPVVGTELLRGLVMTVSLLTCCCLLPSILYVFPVLSFTMPVMVEERTYFVPALKRSMELARFNPRRRFLELPWVRVLAVALVGFLLQLLASFIVGLPVGAGQTVSIFRRVAAGEPVRNPGVLLTWGQAATQAVAALLNTAVSIYVVFVISLLYHDTRRRREGGDLAQAIAALAPPAGGPPNPPDGGLPTPPDAGPGAPPGALPPPPSMLPRP
jgi:hypothetical protein